MIGWLRWLGRRLCRPWLRPGKILHLTTRTTACPLSCGGLARPGGFGHYDLSDFSITARQTGLTQLWLDVPWWQVRPRILVRLAHDGWRWCWLGRDGIWCGLPTRWVGYLRAAQILWTRWCRRLGWERELKLELNVDTRLQMALCDDRTVGTGQTATPESSFFCPVPAAPISARRVLHILKTCLQGGVERQAAYLVAEQVRVGWQVQVVYLFSSLAEAETAHGWFHSAGVKPVCLAPQPIPATWNCLPRPLAEQAAMILPTIRTFQPNVVHAWIDDANTAALWAGVNAQVPVLVMTALGLSPGRCPEVRTPWMRPLYRLGLELPNVHLVCISNFGIRDYAEWLKVPSHRLRQIRIALPPIAPVPASQRSALRQSLGIPLEAPVLVGIFRLEPEKRPFLFLKVAAALLREMPSLHVIHIGSGSLGQRVDAEIRRQNLQPRFHRLGRVADPLIGLAASDVLLLTSAAEGTPNVALEAQALGVVPILTDVGACCETLADGQTGILVPPDDFPAMVTQARLLFEDDARRKRLAAAGPRFVAEHFGLHRFFTAFKNLYDETCRANWSGAMPEVQAAALA